MIPTIIISSLIGIAVTAVIVNEIIKKKNGRPSCSCGGNCGACGLCNTAPQKDDKPSNGQ